MSGWQDKVPTSGSVKLPPDPRALEGLGRNHSFDTALADLVDNSIDAGASDVLIRLIRHGGRLRSLYVVDNGRGMSPFDIDTAMTVGGRRDYAADDLGHFGIGLQSASFSQARVLTVMSSAEGHGAVGRRLTLDDDRAFHADIVPVEFAHRELVRDWGVPGEGTGTVIRWDEVIGFPVTDDATRVEEFVSGTIRMVSNHLGLVFHRLLSGGRIRIALEVEDTDSGFAGARFLVSPLDPFGYKRSGRAGYPRELKGRSDSGQVVFRCHIWNRSNLPEFKLLDGGERRQGLYICRRDRLLQAGGDWGGITALAKRLQLARVAIDLDDDVIGLFRMNPEKSRVIVGPDFTHLAEKAVAEDGTTFAQYLEDAEQAFRESNKRTRERRKMIPPGKGFAPGLRRAIADEVPFTDESDEPIGIRWKQFDGDDFFEVDRAERVLWLNDRYRTTVLGGRRGGLNDAPIIKSLLYLLLEEVFEGDHLGPRDKDNLNLWQEIITAAAKSERS
ncbi:ATP-binding protein [Actinomadura rudentiformis]|uniref:ATP-binding protein n=1 Tax=Actinomadura rudentiformis TaxID=359158 RepID=A0A6H9YG88_9ACTN|nr:ATP-binding protein [Actinomadura rudentiformis]KAB2340886.1 ATP-binding protein [Actinomadura rudentiformis]